MGPKLHAESPVAEWVKLPFRINEFIKSQEAAGRILSETDFENLTPVQAHELLTKTIPSIGNTRSGASAFQAVGGLVDKETQL